MKKSQVFAALALAFALGVVAPVVSTVSAFTPEVKNDKGVVTTQGSATKEDVLTAIDAVSALYPEYDKMVTLYDLVNDTKITSANLLVSDYTAIETALTNNAGFGVSTSAIAEANAVTPRVARANAFVALAEGVEHYGAVAAWVHAHDATTRSDAELQAAIRAINASFGTSIDSSTDVTFANYAAKGVQSQVVAAINSVETYNTFTKLVRDTDKAKANADAYTHAFNALVNALNDVELTSGVAGGQAALEAALAKENSASDSYLTPISDLTAIVTSGVVNYSAWISGTNSVMAKIELAKSGAINGDYNTNYNKIIAIAQAIKDIPAVDPDTSVAQIAAQLVAYKAPEAGEGEGAGDNEDPSVKPGQQGILTTAEGTAAASAGIMAAVATALTAAGVGVVAFRNARRK